MVDDVARKAEQRKYIATYRDRAKYRMSGPRLEGTIRHLASMPVRGSLLDVSCGRQELMRSALRLGFAHVAGTEYTPELVDGDRVVFAAAHDMPFADGTFDVVTMCDVIEHLLPGDDEAACRELARVATRHVLISANNLDSFGSDGSQLHINKRPYAEWDALFREWFAGCRVEWLKPPAKHSEFWRIDL